MRHYYTQEGRGAHFAVNSTGTGAVVTQLGDTSAEQVRISLTPEEARGFAARLLEAAHKASLEPSKAELIARAGLAKD